MSNRITYVDPEKAYRVREAQPPVSAGMLKQKPDSRVMIKSNLTMIRTSSGMREALKDKDSPDRAGIAPQSLPHIRDRKSADRVNRKQGTGITGEQPGYAATPSAAAPNARAYHKAAQGGKVKAGEALSGKFYRAGKGVVKAVGANSANALTSSVNSNMELDQAKTGDMGAKTLDSATQGIKRIGSAGRNVFQRARQTVRKTRFVKSGSAPRAAKGVRKTAQQVRRSAKATVDATKRTVKTVRTVSRATVKVVKVAVKAAVTAVKAVGKAIAAVASNPVGQVALVVLAVVLLLLLLVSAISAGGVSPIVTPIETMMGQELYEDIGTYLQDKDSALRSEFDGILDSGEYDGQQYDRLEKEMRVSPSTSPKLMCVYLWAKYQSDMTWDIAREEMDSIHAELYRIEYEVGYREVEVLIPRYDEKGGVLTK